jgi:hypothetical protein
VRPAGISTPLVVGRHHEQTIFVVTTLLAGTIATLITTIITQLNKIK